MESGNGQNAGAIVAAVLVPLLFLLLCIIILWRRKQRQLKEARKQSSSRLLLVQPLADVEAGSETFSFLCRLRHDSDGKFKVRLEARDLGGKTDILIAHVGETNASDDRGRLQVDDLLRSVNGTDVHGLGLKDVKRLLAEDEKHQGVVDLVLERVGKGPPAMSSAQAEMIAQASASTATMSQEEAATPAEPLGDPSESLRRI